MWLNPELGLCLCCCGTGSGVLLSNPDVLSILVCLLSVLPSPQLGDKSLDCSAKPQPKAQLLGLLFFLILVGFVTSQPSDLPLARKPAWG